MPMSLLRLSVHCPALTTLATPSSQPPSEHYTKHIAARHERRQHVENLRAQLEKAEQKLKEDTEQVGASPRPSARE